MHEKFTPTYYTKKEENDARLIREDIQKKEIDDVFLNPIDEKIITQRKQKNQQPE